MCNFFDGDGNPKAAAVGAFALEQQLPEDMLDTLITSGVASDVLISWTAQQETLLPQAEDEDVEGAVATAPVEPMIPIVRSTAQKFMQHLCQTIGLDVSGWFSAVLIFDILRSKGELDYESIPETCVALVAMLKRNDTTETAVNVASLAREASQLSAYLHSFNLGAGAQVTARQVSERELRILEVLGWRINVASVHSWLLAIGERFSIILGGRLAETLEWVAAQSVASAGVYLQSTSSCSRMTPQRLANSLFCTGLIKARLLPLEVMRSEKVDAQTWEDLYARSQGQGVAAGKSHSLSPQHLRHMLCTLQVSTGCTLDELRSDMFAVGEAVREVMEAAHAAQAACQTMQLQGAAAHQAMQEAGAMQQAGALPPRGTALQVV